MYDTVYIRKECYINRAHKHVDPKPSQTLNKVHTKHHLTASPLSSVASKSMVTAGTHITRPPFTCPSPDFHCHCNNKTLSITVLTSFL